MELFVYSWFYNRYTVYGHSLDDDGEYRLIRVRDFMPSCFVEGETVPRCTVVPAKAEYKRMLSSRDVSLLRPFYRLFFRNGKEMELFAREQRCYMADIPQITAFLSQIGADHVGWVRVPKLDVNTAEIEALQDKIPMSSPRVMSFDIEVKSMDSGMPQPYRITDTVEMISVVTFGNGVPTNTYIMHTLKKRFGIPHATDIVCDGEVDLITKFFELVGKEDPTVITGFNIYGFDMHYLVSRLRLRLLEIPDVSRGIGNSIDLIKVDWTSDAYGHNSYDRLVIGGRLIVDMYLYFKRMKLDKYSLDFVSNKFLGEGKDDMPYVKMAGAFESGDHDVLLQVAQYCIQDSMLVVRLFDKVQMWIDACEISKITRCGIEDIYTRGEQMKMVSQCVAECAKRNIVLQPQFPSEWKQYEGAYVLEPVKGVYDGCSILDFQSLYPSIIIAYNICPSTYTKKKVDSYCVAEHHFRKEPIGLLPGMIKRILDERKTVKKRMLVMDNKKSVEYIVLDRRQNALKICANSVYGMMGFKNSRYFGHLGCAESVTTVGRLLLAEIVEKIERSYPVKVVYGDSVTGYTPTIVRIGGEFVLLETFENIGVRWGKNKWIESEGKEFCELDDVEVWTNDGWTAMHRVIRHALAPHKRIIRVLTHTGIVDVTDEHSLLNPDGLPVSADSVEVGDRLLHHPYPTLQETEYSISPKEAMIFGMFCGDGSCGTYECGRKTSWAINNADSFLLLKYKKLCEEVYMDYAWTVTFDGTFFDKRCCAADTVGVYKLSPSKSSQACDEALSLRYRSTMYRNKEKTVPSEILNSNLETRQAFWDGLYDAKSFQACNDLGDREYKKIDQVTIASFALLASSIGYSTSLKEDNIFILTVTKAAQRKDPTVVKKANWIEYTGYVYDVTTDNHRFQAGPGNMIVHNTDSCMLWHSDKKSSSECRKLAESICDDITSSIPPPMALKFETYCDKVILLTKKRYVLVSGDSISYKGVMNARRDYCKYAKSTYANAVEMVAKGREDVTDYIDKRILTLLSGRANVHDLVVTKSMARKLSTYKVNQPHVVLARRLVQKTGNDIPAGTRLEFVYVRGQPNMVTPEEFAEGGWTVDGMFYVEKQLATQIDDVLSAVGMGSYIKDTWLMR